jgi:hypothetical protein
MLLMAHLLSGTWGLNVAYVAGKYRLMTYAIHVYLAMRHAQGVLLP